MPESSPDSAASAGNPAAPGFDAVAVGTGMGIYGLTRSLHQTYGVVTDVVQRKVMESLRRSVTTNAIELGSGAGDTAILDHLLEMGRQRPAGRRALLLCNSDRNVQLFNSRRDELEEFYALPYVGAELFDRVADKAVFAEIATKLDVPIPATKVIDFDAELPPRPGAEELDFPFPVVGKAASSADFGSVRFEGKEKVFKFETPAAMHTIFDRIHAAGFRGRFVVQDLVPGDDTAIRSITAYRSRAGKVTMFGMADVLLEEHAPDALGRPAAALTGHDEEAYEHTVRILDELDYVGYANLDAKVDARDGAMRFFEINPRMGRNCFYNDGAGQSVSRPAVEDLILDRPEADPAPLEPTVFTTVPLPFLLRYITDPAQKREVRAAARRSTVNPWQYRAEGPWMHLYARAVQAKSMAEFMKYFPRPTGTGF